MKTLLTATFIATSLVAPAQAFTLDQSHQQLANTIRSAGIRVYVDPYHCDERPIAGYYNGQVIGLCAQNTPDRADFQDTLRHEAIHMAQRCKAVYTESADDLVILSETSAQIGLRRFANEVSQYPPEIWPIEAEAWGGAYYLDADQVESVLRKQCSFLF